MPDSFELVGLGGLGDPQRLRADADRARAEPRPDRRPGAGQEGADPTDAVRVLVSAQGAVLDVLISRRWVHRIAPDGLGEAILLAYRQAEEKRSAVRPRAYEPRHARAEIPDIHDERWLDWVAGRLDEAGRSLRVLAAATAHRPEPPTVRTVDGPARYTRVLAVGALVTEILIDAPRTAEREPDLIAQDVRAALNRARRGEEHDA